MLELQIKLPTVPVYINTPLPVKATLLNNGDTPVLINMRLSVGYKNSLSRELYAEIKSLKTDKPAEYFPNDINRNFADLFDYKLFYPGDSISTTFNLFEYYPLKESGYYELILHYQADEKLADTPAGIWKGILSSEPERFEILSGERPNEN